MGNSSLNSSKQYAVCDVEWKQGCWSGQPLVRRLQQWQELSRLRLQPAQQQQQVVAASVGEGEKRLRAFLEEHVSGWDEDEDLTGNMRV